MARRSKLAKVAGLGLLGALTLSGCSYDDVAGSWLSWGWPEGVTDEAHEMHRLWIGSTIAALVVGIAVWLLIAYAAIGIYLAVQKKKASCADRRMSDFDRMEQAGQRRKPTVHAMRTELDETDRRLMAIDHHINSQNEQLAREIEALRQEEK